MKDRYKRVKYYCKCDRAMAIPGKKCIACNRLEDCPIPRIKNKLLLKNAEIEIKKENYDTI